MTTSQLTQTHLLTHKRYGKLYGESLYPKKSCILSGKSYTQPSLLETPLAIEVYIVWISVLFCQEDRETLEHLFLKCHFARVVWLGNEITIRTDTLPYHTISDWI